MQFRNMIPGELGVDSERPKSDPEFDSGERFEVNFLYLFESQKRFRIHFWGARDASKVF